MNVDAVTSVFSETRSEYTNQLCLFLVPAYFQFFVNLFTKVKETTELKKVLWQFQNVLNEVHDWNMEKVHNEISLINTNTGCDYLEDLLTAVFIAHTKVLTAIRLTANNKKIEITVPKVEHFLFKVLCEISKLLWSSTYLFREDISGIDRQQNYKLIEGMIREGITQAIRGLVPVKSILKNLVTQTEVTQPDLKPTDTDNKDDNEDKEDDSDDDEPAEKSAVETPKAVTEAPKAVAETPIAETPKEAPIAETPIAVANTEIAALEPISLDTSAPPQIINLDEKPSVSFAKFNPVFSTEHPDESTMADAIEESDTPDLEILDQDGGSLLSSGDFDDLNDLNGNSEPLNNADYDELP